MSEIILDPDGDLRLQLRDYCSDAFDDDISAVLAPAQEQLAVEDTAPVDTTTGDEPTAEKATLSLIVSSELLSAASPIFEIMLQGKFKEGLELARCKETSTIYTIELPEDDAEAALVFCSVLHDNMDHAPATITPTLLSELATFVDKYMCAEVLEYIGETWIKDELDKLVFPGTCNMMLQTCEGSEGMALMERLCKCLFFAYKVDLAAEYSLIGAALVRIINDDGIHELKNLIDQLHFNHNVLGTSRASIQPHPSQMGLLTFCTKKTWRQRETAACVKYTGQ